MAGALAQGVGEGGALGVAAAGGLALALPPVEEREGEREGVEEALGEAVPVALPLPPPACEALPHTVGETLTAAALGDTEPEAAAGGEGVGSCVPAGVAVVLPTEGEGESVGVALDTALREGLALAEGSWLAPGVAVAEAPEGESVGLGAPLGEGSGEGVGVAEAQREGRGLRLALALGRAERE